MPCECTEPGHCPIRNQVVTRLGLRICQSGDDRSKAAYFTGKPGAALPMARIAKASTPCRFLGEPLKDAAGLPVLRECRSCRGTVKLKVLACEHPGPAHDGTTTEKACRACPDYSGRMEDEG